MRTIERQQVRTICRHVLAVVQRTKGTANKEVLQQKVVRLESLLRKGRLREAESVAYGAIMEYQGLPGKDDEMAEDHETSKAPMTPVENTVDIGRSIKFVRVAAGIRQGEMAKRLAISQNYLSLLENNRAEPSLSLLRRISSEFHVPVNFLLLEASVEFTSDEPQTDSLLKQLQNLIHQLQIARIKESEGAKNGVDAASDPEAAPS